MNIPRNEEVTIVLVTLNEEANIREAIESFRAEQPREIIVVDGGSTDGTIAIAKHLADKVHVVGKRGLAYQRQYGIDKCETECVLLVDADNRLERGCVEALKHDLLSSAFVGVAAQKIALSKDSYWSRAQSWINETEFNVPGEKLVIGTPALYRTSVVREVRFDPFFTCGDDTDLCYRLARHGFKVAAGSGICYEKMRDTLASVLTKAFKYGVADAQFFWKHPARRWSIGTHALRNYVIKKTVRAVAHARFEFVAYTLVFGLVRLAGLVVTIIKMSIGEDVGTHIEKT